MTEEIERLRRLREERGWTQDQLSRESGISRIKISRIETGERRMTATDAAFLSEALGVRTDDLIGRRRTTMRFRLASGAVEAGVDPVDRVARWFDEFVDDALYLERQAIRYGVD